MKACPAVLIGCRFSARLDQHRGHLRNRNVTIGDIFLFFGLFRHIHINANHLSWKVGSTPRHVIWGWLQVGQIIPVDSCNREKLMWGQYHPHFHRYPERNNTLYAAKKYLELPNTNIHKKSAGIFENFTQKLQLTAPGGQRAGVWELPKWFFPHDDRLPLSYHGDLKRWELTDVATILNVVSRGQEFILECEDYPEVTEIYLRICCAEPELVKIWRDLTGCRNDLNHAGFRAGARPATTFPRQLAVLVKRIEKYQAGRSA